MAIFSTMKKVFYQSIIAPDRLNFFGGLLELLVLLQKQLDPSYNVYQFL